MKTAVHDINNVHRGKYTVIKQLLDGKANQKVLQLVGYVYTWIYYVSVRIKQNINIVASIAFPFTWLLWNKDEQILEKLHYTVYKVLLTKNSLWQALHVGYQIPWKTIFWFYAQRSWERISNNFLVLCKFMEPIFNSFNPFTTTC